MHRAISKAEALAELYEKTGDDEKVQKYTKKIEIIKGNMEKDRQLAEENRQAAAEKQRLMTEVLTTEGTGKVN